MVKKFDENKVKEHPTLYGDFDREEWINGIHYDLSPAPVINHQKLVVKLGHVFYQTCQPNGIVLVSPVDVHFDRDNQVQPDLVFITNENSDIIKEKRIEGAPDLLCEILSPSSGTHDKIRKKELYERFGVKEYWLIDPVHFFVDQFVLKNGKYDLQKTHADTDTITSDNLSCISVDLSDVFADIR